MKVRVTKIKTSYSWNGFLTFLYGRGENGKRVKVQLLGVEPYFYSDEIPNSPLVTHIEYNAAISIYGNKVHKIYVRTPKDVPEVRKTLPVTYEADVPFDDRVRYDLGIMGYVEIPDGERILDVKEVRPIQHPDDDIIPRIMFLDIETDDSNGFASPKYPTAEVVSITVYDNYTDSYFILTTSKNAKKPDGKVFMHTYKNESDLFKAFKILLNEIQPDIISGWNVDDYDVSYLKNRFSKYLFDPYVIFDLMKAYDKLQPNVVPSLKLEWVAQHELGEGKMPRGTIMEFWESGDLTLYNYKDVELVKRLDDKLKIVDYFLTLSLMAGCPLENTLYNSRVVESFIFHRFHGEFVLPTTPEQVEDNESYKGAIVFQPPAGVFENVIDIDNKAEYPTVIRSFNLSPEKRFRLKEDGTIEYDASTRGIVPKLLDELVEVRDRLKQVIRETDDKEEREILKKKERALKFLVNSTYGVFGFKRFRLYDRDMASIVTYVARKHLEWNKMIAHKLGGEVIYGDTDSTFVVFGEDVKDIQELAKKLEKELNDSFDDFFKSLGGVGKHYFKTKIDEIFERVLFVGVKKRYAYKTIDGEYGYRGFELRRGNSAEITKRIQKEVIDMILDGASRREIISFVRTIVDRIRNRDVEDWEIGKPIAYRQEEYKVKTQALKAIEYSNEHLGTDFKVGDRPLLFYVRRVNGKPPTDVIAWTHDPLPDVVELDYDRTIDKIILSPVELVLKVFGIDKTALLTGLVQTTLF